MTKCYILHLILENIKKNSQCFLVDKPQSIIYISMQQLFGQSMDKLQLKELPCDYLNCGSILDSDPTVWCSASSANYLLQQQQLCTNTLSKSFLERLIIPMGSPANLVQASS